MTLQGKINQDLFPNNSKYKELINNYEISLTLNFLIMWYSLKSIWKKGKTTSFYVLQKPVSVYYLVFIFPVWSLSKYRITKFNENQVIVFIVITYLSEAESEELKIKDMYEKCCWNSKKDKVVKVETVRLDSWKSRRNKKKTIPRWERCMSKDTQNQPS